MEGKGRIRDGPLFLREQPLKVIEEATRRAGRKPGVGNVFGAEGRGGVRVAEGVVCKEQKDTVN